MSIFPEPKVHATCLYSLNDENNICILLDASTVTQILKIRRTTILDAVTVQLAEQNNRTATILGQPLQIFSHLRDLNIEGPLPVKSYQAKVVDKDYSALPFCIHRIGLGYDICKRSRGIINIDWKVADLCHTCLKFCPIIHFCLMNLLRTKGTTYIRLCHTFKERSYCLSSARANSCNSSGKISIFQQKLISLQSIVQV